MGETEENAESHEDGKVYSRDIMNDMISTLSSKVSSNNLEALKNYIENENSTIKDNASAIKYNYNLNINLYKEDTSNGVVRVLEWKI